MLSRLERVETQCVGRKVELKHSLHNKQQHIVGETLQALTAFEELG